MLDIPAKPKKPSPVDVHVGSRIRIRRNLIGMSQEMLGDKVGITFQQIQKYEKGTNRVGASRLQQIATALGVSPSYFFEEQQADTQDAGEDEITAALRDPQVLQLVRAFTSIAGSNARLRIVGMTKLIADLSSSPDA